jgi:hypothetical protein
MLLFCSINGAEELYIGQKSSDVIKLLTKHGWIDQLVKFELEKSFSDKGGKISVWKSPSGTNVQFESLPIDGVDFLSVMEIPDKDMGERQLRLKVIFAD